jgi:hypothetical protein
MFIFEQLPFGEIARISQIIFCLAEIAEIAEMFFEHGWIYCSKM